MPTTTNIKLSTPAHASNVNVWDADPINNNSNILDICFGTVTTKSLTNANVTLSATEAQAAILRFSGTLSGNVTIDVSAIRKFWTCENNTLGAFVVTLSGGSGNVIGLPDGSSQAYWDGTNCGFINLGRVGQYWDDTGSAVPSWVSACTVPPALLCNGGSFSAVTYPLLNKKLGGTTLPDARGRARFALNAGTGRLTTAGGIDGNTLQAGGGFGTGLSISQTHLPGSTLATTIPAGQANHTHPAANGNFLEYLGAGGTTQFTPGTGAYNLDNSTGAQTLGTMTGTTLLGGSSTPLPSVSPGYVGGVTMIWAL